MGCWGNGAGREGVMGRCGGLMFGVIVYVEKNVIPPFPVPTYTAKTHFPSPKII